MKQSKKIILALIIFSLMNVSCGFDHDKADTKNNKGKFKDYLKVDLTPDVKDIYCFGDFIGIDSSVYFSFTCDSTTIQRIIDRNNLVLSDSYDRGLSLNYNFTWWDEEKIAKIRPYKTDEGGNLIQYLWYDKENKKAYYQKFSI
ncbi:MAG: hypothetical protein E6767_19710 [Dysgonomonas sp.]|nr:hypothetical protein [Dysgonomonas sp.]